MSGSIYGNLFRISTWGESHGKAIGVVVDGCPAGIELCEEDIQLLLDRRKPGGNQYTSPRQEDDLVEILSGVFEGKTTGTPISMIVRNKDHRSTDYSEIVNYYRPGHADFGFDSKFGFRDYRGGGRSSGRETIGRVAAGAIAKKILASIGVSVDAYVSSIGPVKMNTENFDLSQARKHPLGLPDKDANSKAEDYITHVKRDTNSAGGTVDCVVNGMPAGIGEPVFDKLDANLGKAIFSIGAVKGVEIGDGFSASESTGLTNNDAFYFDGQKIAKRTNHSGGILGGMSDGSPITIRAAFKPTPSIFAEQETVNKQNENITINIRGRHDPIIVPRAAVVVESMVAITLVDALFQNMTSKIDSIIKHYNP